MKVTFNIDSPMIPDIFSGSIRVNDEKTPYNYTFFINNNTLVINYNEELLFDGKNTMEINVCMEREIVKHMVRVRKNKLDKI